MRIYPINSTMLSSTNAKVCRQCHRTKPIRNFISKNNASIDVRLRLTYLSETAQQVSVELSRDNSKIIILRNTQEYQTLRTLMKTYSEVAGIVNGFASIIIIEDSLDISVYAYNGNEESYSNVVSSDVYETSLVRPKNDYLIEWDEESQTFSWSNHLADTTGLTYILDVTYSIKFNTF